MMLIKYIVRTLARHGELKAFLTLAQTVFQFKYSLNAILETNICGCMNNICFLPARLER